MQFMPATAEGLGVNPLDPASAINGAAKYLSSLTEQFGSTELALAAYNAGPGHGEPLRRHPALLRDPELRARRDDQGGGLPMNAPVTATAPAVRPKSAAGPEPRGSAGASAVRLRAGRRPLRRPAARGSSASDRGVERRDGRADRAIDREADKDARTTERSYRQGG